MAHKAFTLVEVLIVVLILGFLAAIVIPKYAKAHHDTVIAATSEDLRAIENALHMYYSRNGSYPKDVNRGRFPAELEPYFKSENPLGKAAPLGGRYDYEGPPNWSPVQISIRFESDAMGHSTTKAQELDEYMDDGNLKTGLLRRAGDRTFYIISK